MLIWKNIRKEKPIVGQLVLITDGKEIGLGKYNPDSSGDDFCSFDGSGFGGYEWELNDEIKMPKHDFLERLKIAIDSPTPYFSYNGVSVYVSSKCPKDKIYFIDFSKMKIVGEIINAKTE